MTYSNHSVPPSSPSAQSQAERLSEVLRNQDIQQLRADMSQKLEPLQTETHQLRQRSNGIITFMVFLTLGWLSSLALAGYYVYRQGQIPVPAAVDSSGEVESAKLATLEEQLQNLSQRFPADLLVDVQTNRETLQQLSEQLSQVQQNEAALKQLRQSIEDLGQKVTQPLAAPSAPATEVDASSDASSTSPSTQLREEAIPSKPD